MDGWLVKPDGWNDFDDLQLAHDDIINVNIADYPHAYIFVLCGGLDYQGRNHPWVQDRLDIAYRLYTKHKCKIVILGGGSYHVPSYLNHEGFVLHESTMGAKYLIDLGVDPNDILREWASYDTIANGLFSLVNFVIPLRLREVLVITSDFHMPRSKAIFNWIYALYDKTIKVDYLEVSTKYLDAEIIAARTEKETQSLENLKATINEIDSLQKFHNWFYTDHKAYNCKFSETRDPIDEKVKQSY